MSYDIVSTTEFLREAKYLSKKYHSFKADLAALISELTETPKTGISLGNNTYKIRMAIESKGKGKSGGARVITYVAVVRSTVYLVGIYDKSEQETMKDQEIRERLNRII